MVAVSLVPDKLAFPTPKTVMLTPRDNPTTKDVLLLYVNISILSLHSGTDTDAELRTLARPHTVLVLTISVVVYTPLSGTPVGLKCGFSPASKFPPMPWAETLSLWTGVHQSQTSKVHVTSIASSILTRLFLMSPSVGTGPEMFGVPLGGESITLTFFHCQKLIASSPGSSCINYVANTPAAFAQAYWQINSLRVFSS